MICRLTSRRSQPPMALAVPLSRFTSRVGGGSAFYVRRIRHTMTNREWTDFMSGLLDAIERELHPDAPTEDREALRAFRSRFERKRVTEARKPYERKIDRLVESRPFLFAAAHRHIGKILPPAVEQAASAMKRARALLDRAPNQSPEPTAVTAGSSASRFTP